MCDGLEFFLSFGVPGIRVVSHCFLVHSVSHCFILFHSVSSFFTLFLGVALS